MTRMKNMCLCVTPELEQQIVDYRKKPGYERMSLSEIARILIRRGLEVDEKENKDA